MSPSLQHLYESVNEDVTISCSEQALFESALTLGIQLGHLNAQ